MKCFIVLVAVAAVCNAHPHHHGAGSGAGGAGFGAGGAGFGAGGSHHQQRFKLTADSYGNGPSGAAGSGAPIPEREPIVVEQELPAAYNVNFGAHPKVIDHEACPAELDYFEKPTVINHQKQARLNVFPQQPVVVDTFEAPHVSEQPGPHVVSVEQVAAGAGSAGGAGGAGGAGFGMGGAGAGGAGYGMGGAGAGAGGAGYGMGGAGAGAGGAGFGGYHIVDNDHPGHLEPAHPKHHPVIVVPPPCQ